jgi:hypothetical protein
MNSRTRLVVAAATLAWICTPRPGSAEIVYLTSGRTLSIKEHRVDGESIVLTLRSGGQVTCDRTLIDRILPDEVPHVDPPSAQAVPYAAPRELQPTTVLERTPYAEIIARASQAHGVNPLLVHALIQVESNYQPRAKSHKGAMGLMQLMPSLRSEIEHRGRDQAPEVAHRPLRPRAGPGGLQRGACGRAEVQGHSAVSRDPQLRSKNPFARRYAVGTDPASRTRNTASTSRLSPPFVQPSRGICGLRVRDGAAADI